MIFLQYVDDEEEWWQTRIRRNWNLIPLWLIPTSKFISFPNIFLSFFLRILIIIQTSVFSDCCECESHKSTNNMWGWFLYFIWYESGVKTGIIINYLPSRNSLLFCNCAIAWKIYFILFFICWILNSLPFCYRSLACQNFDVFLPHSGFKMIFWKSSEAIRNRFLCCSE